jgi:hypothetical protein
MLVETALALFFPALCILMLAGKIMHGPIPINSAVTRNRRGRLSASRVSI